MESLGKSQTWKKLFLYSIPKKPTGITEGGVHMQHDSSVFSLLA
jgi:hypothetical protein